VVIGPYIDSKQGLVWSHLSPSRRPSFHPLFHPVSLILRHLTHPPVGSYATFKLLSSLAPITVPVDGILPPLLNYLPLRIHATYSSSHCQCRLLHPLSDLEGDAIVIHHTVLASSVFYSSTLHFHCFLLLMCCLSLFLPHPSICIQLDRGFF
jgi:hypothetical protein